MICRKIKHSQAARGETIESRTLENNRYASGLNPDIRDRNRKCLHYFSISVYAYFMVVK
ncbi:uncharacterized protein SPAPADRAFT_62043 [Spathaspora passalidarum NRRL Y-27907]|uniref:Uncharacterized protein n=1 Tax=Spathaspora passalidarum (strain NRRL Y-27907 / 11-Y1) TaxID=619300 RepID=G3AQC6_SPAPN|nr:uncharacterized protein SPAPADRAFT_62043 [Spathaspora passalidarum NRRL Y-27907]EGW31473.1 hypothetical protein SPAPADRAFT_62043 [Spathaspora passalidarum NRRL Y-27907]